MQKKVGRKPVDKDTALAILYWYDVCNLGYLAISKKLKISPSTVRNVVRRRNRSMIEQQLKQVI
jgi:ribonuclease P protein component